jgi:hypothetical protein
VKQVQQEQQVLLELLDLLEQQVQLGLLVELHL